MDLFFQCLFGLAILVNVLILLSGIDDAFIDIYYWVRRFYRRITIRRHHPKFNLENLHYKSEAPFAILVPAWKEFSVIAEMIQGANTNLEYGNFHIFAGTYINDGETQAEVDRMARRYRNVHRVDVPHPGPTCKADCLNWLVKSIFDFEKEQGQEFAGLVIHDSEDVIHPLELKVFNYFIDRKDIIQLPVLSLEREWHQLVAGTYQDDFAESHSKDMVVRESITDLVPCAGTGMCYSRRAIAALIEETGQMPFNTGTLTEDYDFSFRLKKYGMNQAFIQLPVEYTSNVKTPFGQREATRFSMLGVREFFPSNFRAAYRQRARWVLGISLQGWETLGWKGNLVTKYYLWRDRKGLFTSLITLPAYLLVLTISGIFVANQADMDIVLPEYFTRPGGVLNTLLLINLVIFANRLFQRIYFVSRLYGFVHGLLTVPRIVVNNFINFAAVCRAWKQYLVHRVTGKPLAWDKTAHAFPTNGDQGIMREKIGEILLEWQGIEESQLEEALRRQTNSGHLLGRILVDQFGVSEALLADALAEQAKLPRSTLQMSALAQNQKLIPQALTRKHGWVPLGIGEHEEILLGVSGSPGEEALADATKHFTQQPKFFILTESESACALAFLLQDESSAVHSQPIHSQDLVDATPVGV